MTRHERLKYRVVSTVNRVARRTRPLVDQAVARICGRTHQAPVDPSLEARLKEARGRESAILVALLEVDRVVQSHTEAVAALQEEQVDRPAVSALIQPSLSLLSRRESELDLERQRLLSVRGEEHERIQELQQTLGSTSRPLPNLHHVGHRLEQAGENLTDWLDAVSQSVQRVVFRRGPR